VPDSATRSYLRLVKRNPTFNEKLSANIKSWLLTTCHWPLLSGGFMSDELQELQEHAEKARENQSLAAVSLTMAVLAVCVAVVSLLGHRAHTEEVVLQAKASDQWAYYQAKNIREHEDELFGDMAGAVASTDAGAMTKFKEKSEQEGARYKGEKKEIENEARKLEAEVAMERSRADRYDLAEVFLEIGLVITSITLLSGRKIFWQLGIVLSVVGVVVAVMGALVH
jgi:Domain of unknown function (DUF4337)